MSVLKFQVIYEAKDGVVNLPKLGITVRSFNPDQKRMWVKQLQETIHSAKLASGISSLHSDLPNEIKSFSGSANSVSSSKASNGKWMSSLKQKFRQSGGKAESSKQHAVRAVVNSEQETRYTQSPRQSLGSTSDDTYRSGSNRTPSSGIVSEAYDYRTQSSSATSSVLDSRRNSCRSGLAQSNDISLSEVESAAAWVEGLSVRETPSIELGAERAEEGGQTPVKIPASGKGPGIRVKTSMANIAGALRESAKSLKRQLTKRTDSGNSDSSTEN